MAETIATYEARVSGLWNTRHTISSPEGQLGVMIVARNGRGMITSGNYTPVKGEVLRFRRDPGLLRSQFSLWTEGREWLGSSLRSNFLRREIALATGNKPYRLVPTAAFGRGWRMFAPKSGEMARIEPLTLRRTTKIDVFRRVDFELLLFAYFLGSQVYPESFWPSRDLLAEQESSIPTPSKA